MSSYKKATKRDLFLLVLFNRDSDLLARSLPLLGLADEDTSCLFHRELELS